MKFFSQTKFAPYAAVLALALAAGGCGDSAPEPTQSAPAPAAAPKAMEVQSVTCLLYTSPSPRDLSTSRMPSSA